MRGLSLRPASTVLDGDNLFKIHGGYHAFKGAEAVSHRADAGKLCEYMEGLSHCGVHKEQFDCRWRFNRIWSCVCGVMRLRAVTI